MKNNKESSVTSKWFAPACAALMMTAGQANAASISYILDQSNVLTDGPAYLQVTISDGAEGGINFTVAASQSLLDLAGENFGIQSFAFNIAPGGDAEGASVTNLPDGWITRDHYRMTSFGFFDIKLYGGGQSRLDTLTFSIDGIDGDTIADYAVLSTGGASGGNQLFSARVAGFELGEGCAPNNESRIGSSSSHKKCVTSAFFGGSTSNINSVPLPATAWLFGTGFLGAVLRARRRK